MGIGVANNVSFASFVSLVDANKGASGSKFVKLQGVAGHSVCIKPSADDTIFSWFRSSGQKVVNNQVRDAFLSSVLTRLNLSDASQLPAEIKKTMSLSDYNGSNRLASSLTGATGSSTTGKPLKLRTIRDVVAAVRKYEASRNAFKNSPADFDLREFDGPGRDFVNKEYKHFESCLKGFDYKGHTQDVLANMFTRMASYSEGVKSHAGKDPMILFGDRYGVSNLHVPALRTCLNSNPEFRNYINNDPKGTKRILLEQYANSGNGVSHQIAKDLLEMLRVNDSIKLTDDIRKQRTGEARYKLMDGMKAKDLVAFFKTAFAYPQKLPITRQLAADYVKNKLGPMLLQDDGGFFVRKYVGNYFMSPDGDSSKDVSWAKVVLQTLKETVLPNMKSSESDYVDEYQTRIDDLLKLI